MTKPLSKRRLPFKIKRRFHLVCVNKSISSRKFQGESHGHPRQVMCEHSNASKRSRNRSGFLLPLNLPYPGMKGEKDQQAVSGSGRLFLQSFQHSSEERQATERRDKNSAPWWDLRKAGRSNAGAPLQMEQREREKEGRREKEIKLLRFMESSMLKVRKMDRFIPFCLSLPVLTKIIALKRFFLAGYSVEKDSDDLPIETQNRDINLQSLLVSLRPQASHLS